MLSIPGATKVPAKDIKQAVLLDSSLLTHDIDRYMYIMHYVDIIP